MISTRRIGATAMVVAGMATFLTGCGSDDKAATSTTKPAATTASTAAPAVEAASAAVCDAYAGVMTSVQSESPDPAKIGEFVATIEADAPAEVADQLKVMTDATGKVLASNGEDFSAFEAPEFAAAQGKVDPYMFKNCDFGSTVEVTGREYAFDGVPKTVGAGQVAMLFTNEGKEAHEMAVVRKKDGVTESFDELLEMDEDAAMAKIEHVGGAFAPATGAQSLMVADVTPGEYLMVCFVPVGTTAENIGGEGGDGPPHFIQGMKTEFTVTG